jgi:hypothetical protein
MAKQARAQTSSSAVVPTGFDQVLHLRHRLHLPSLLGLQTLAVYDALRAFVWRQETYGPDDLCERTVLGFLSAKVSQSQLAEVSGVSRPRVNQQLRKLANLGWIVMGGRTGRDKIYELGIRRPQGSTWAEAVYADAVQQSWYEKANDHAKACWGTSYRKLSPANQHATAADVLNKAGALPTGYVMPVVHLKPTAGPKLKQSKPQRALSKSVLPPVERLDVPFWFHPPLTDSEACDVPGKTDGIQLNLRQPLENAAVWNFSGNIRCPQALDVPGERKETETVESASAKSLNYRGSESDIAELRCPLREHQMSPERTSETGYDIDFQPSFQGVTTAENPYIHSGHRMPSPTGKGSNTSYLILSPFGSGSEPSAAFVCLGRSLDSGFSASPLNSFPLLNSNSLLNSFPEPEPEPTPKPPVPLAPLSPVEPSPRLSAENLGTSVTGSEDPPRNEEPRVTLPNRTRASDPTQPPTGTPSEAPEAVPGAGEALPVVPPDLSAVMAVVEQAKQRSRAAVEAKFQKQRTKERKKANLTSDAPYRSQKPAAQRIELAWREEMGAAFPDVPQITWFKREGGKLLARKEGKLITDLLEGYGGDEATVEHLVRGFVTHWDKFGPLLTKTRDGVPTIGLLYACHASVFAELRRLIKTPMNKTEYAEWLATVKHDPFAVPPPELLAAHRATKAGVKK